MSRAILCAASSGRPLPGCLRRCEVQGFRGGGVGAGGVATLKILEQKQREFLSQEKYKRKVVYSQGSKQAVSLSPLYG